MKEREREKERCKDREISRWKERKREKEREREKDAKTKRYLDGRRERERKREREKDAKTERYLDGRRERERDIYRERGEPDFWGDVDRYKNCCSFKTYSILRSNLTKAGNRQSKHQKELIGTIFSSPTIYQNEAFLSGGRRRSRFGGSFVCNS